ncbi:MAG TPA: CDP-alcohol phosphatidyltransferase family protein [Acidimicrobiia bacterium]|nr:CDP-alcohol phosphatidyltransferase family protein [Acidimicrobiia bacterium]
MLDRRWRARVEQGLKPVARGLRRAGITADHLTVLGLLLAALTGWLVAMGRFGWAAVALVASALPDVLDGAVAKTSGTAGPRGAFFDSVVDRVADSLVLGGAAWWFAEREPRLAVLVLAVLALSLIVSYERARAESLGFDARGGLMERAERIVLLVVALTFDILEPVLWVMLALTALTTVQRFVKVWRQASAAPDHARPIRFIERPRVRRLAEWRPSRRTVGADTGALARRRWRAAARRRARP